MADPITAADVQAFLGELGYSIRRVAGADSLRGEQNHPVS
jgi:hypothetical protein